MARLYNFSILGTNNSPSGEFMYIRNSNVWGTPTRNRFWLKGRWRGINTTIKVDGNFNYNNSRTISNSKVTEVAYYFNGKAAGSVTRLKNFTVGNLYRSFSSSSYRKRLQARVFNGNDNIGGGNKSDVLWGYNGNDFLTGLGGNDVLYGGEGSDTILGGAGNDFIAGGTGRDRVQGGSGRDTFYVRRGTGYTIITDFSDGRDRIELGSGRSNLRLSTSGNDVGIYQRGDLIAIVNNAAGDLQRSGKYLV